MGIICFCGYTSMFQFENIRQMEQGNVLRSFPDYGWQTGMNISSDMLMGVVRMLLSLVPVLMTVLLVIKRMELLDELADRESQYRLSSVLI